MPHGACFYDCVGPFETNFGFSHDALSRSASFDSRHHEHVLNRVVFHGAPLLYFLTTERNPPRGIGTEPTFNPRRRTVFSGGRRASVSSSHPPRVLQPQPLVLPPPRPQQRVPGRHQAPQLLRHRPHALVVQLVRLHPRELGQERLPLRHGAQARGEHPSQRPPVVRAQVPIVRLPRRVARADLPPRQARVQLRLELQRPSDPQQPHRPGPFPQLRPAVRAPFPLGFEEGREGRAARLLPGSAVGPLGLLDVPLVVPRHEAERRPARLHEDDVGPTRAEEAGGVHLPPRPDHRREGPADVVELPALGGSPAGEEGEAEARGAREAGGDEPSRPGRELGPLPAGVLAQAGGVPSDLAPDASEPSRGVVRRDLERVGPLRGPEADDLDVGVSPPSLLLVLGDGGGSAPGVREGAGEEPGRRPPGAIAEEEERRDDEGEVAHDAVRRVVVKPLAVVFDEVL
ncbi:hypothetical protein ACHAWF_004913 [Thalassiosira exigua]